MAILCLDEEVEEHTSKKSLHVNDVDAIKARKPSNDKAKKISKYFDKTFY